MRQYHITKNNAGQRADRFLSKAAADIPPSLLQKTFRLRDVKCNGQRIPAHHILTAGDELCAYFPEQTAPPAAPKASLSVYGKAVKNPLVVVYEDEHVLIAHKPANMVTQASENVREQSLEFWFRDYLYRSGALQFDGGEQFLPSVCHRLDRQTSGLLLCAKTAAALRILTEKIRLREIEKRYKAIVWGVPNPSQGVWRDYLYKDPTQSFVTVHKDRTNGAKSASLSYRTEMRQSLSYQGRQGTVSLLDIALHTGRTHQIRVQCASRNHPILGDDKYGSESRQKTPKPLALCAYSLTMNFKGDSGALTYLSGKCFSLPVHFDHLLP